MQVAATGNAEQIDYWNSDVGQRWARNQARTDRAFETLTAALIARAAPQPGERVIDIGCGTGAVTRAMAERVGAGGRVLGVDVSKPMLEQARALTGTGVIEWREEDAGSCRFAPGEFDLLTSRFGVMFFAHPADAFRNLRHALRRGGRLAMLCWRPLADNPWSSVPRAAILQIVPPPAPVPQDAPGPFAFGDAARVGAILAHAGFKDVRSTGVAAPLLMPAAADADAELEEAVGFLTTLGPAAMLLRDQDEATRALGVQAAREAIRAHGVQNVLGASCWLFTATNPG